MRSFRILCASVATATAASIVCAAPAAPAAPKPPPSPATLAAVSADRLVSSAAGTFRRGAGDRLTRTGVLTGTRGLRYVTYQRTYRGLPVIGGDAVVTTDAAGTVRGTAVAQASVIDVGVTPAVPAAAAVATAKAQLAHVTSASAATLSVLSGPAAPRLVHEVTVTGRRADGADSALHVYVDARSGRVLRTRDDVRDAVGHGHWNGDVAIATSGSGPAYSMVDPEAHGLQCGGQDAEPFTGTDDVWGNGGATDLETACVDVLYAAQRQNAMLREWLGRNGVDGAGGDVPAQVGWPVLNAQWNGYYNNFGRSQDGQRQLTSMDIVAHERGHAIFQNTPGGNGLGIEIGGINESAGDIFGALTEAYAANPLDPPDYTVGERADMLGTGPIRSMFDPSLDGAPNCWSTTMPAVVHAAAGPGNHWFYLLAEGSAPGGGKPASPTCDGSTVTGIGVRAAGEIFYNGLLAKTSTWRYADVRTATLTAATNLHPESCAVFRAVRAAWDAVGVPFQAAEPVCTTPGVTDDFAVTVTPDTTDVAAGAAATFALDLPVTSGDTLPVALLATGLPPRATVTFARPMLSTGAATTMRIATSRQDTPAGTYPVTVTAMGPGGTARTTTLTLTVSAGPDGGTCAGTATGPLAVPDAGEPVSSPVTISACGRAPSAMSTVTVDITHEWSGDLVIDLVAPDGTAYPLKGADFDDNTPDVRRTFTVDVFDEPAADGTWQLRMQDMFGYMTGQLNSWSLSL